MRTFSGAPSVLLFNQETSIPFMSAPAHHQFFLLHAKAMCRQPHVCFMHHYAHLLRLCVLFFCLAALPAAAQTSLTATPQTLYENDVKDSIAGPVRTIAVKNTGSAAVTISQIQLSGAQASDFALSSLPTLPLTLAAAETFSIGVSFNAGATGLRTAVIGLTFSGGGAALTIPLRGLGTPGTGGTNEPSLQALLNLLELQVSAGDDNTATNIINSSSTNQKAALLGDEVAMQQFIKSGNGNVTVEPLWVFGPTTSNPVVRMGWYASGNANSRQQLINVGNSPVLNAQTVQVAYTGTTAFDPGSAAFGFYSEWPFFQNRLVYSEDSLNTFTGAVPHHVRVYPYRKGGVRVPDTYIVAFEEHISGFDFQDLVFVVRNVRPATGDATISLLPKADAFVFSGNAAVNYGRDTTLQVENTGGAERHSLLSFPLQAVNDVRSATLRLYGRNRTSAQAASVQVRGTSGADWSENTINYSNAPAATDPLLGNLAVSGAAQYYELDVTAFVQQRFASGLSADFIISDPAAQQQLVAFTSREGGINMPQLVIGTSALLPANTAKLFIENLDRFPAADRYTSSRIQRPWSRDNQTYNSNHDTVRVRMHNKGMVPLVIKGLEAPDTTNWKYLRLAGAPFDTTAFPITINSGTYTDLTLLFAHSDSTTTTTNIKLLFDTLVIVSNDDAEPRKLLRLQGLWQRMGEGNREPSAQQTIDAFGYKTTVGFSGTDPDDGNASKPKGDEVLSSYFVRADTTRPVTVRQMSAYHSCCTATEAFRWYPKGSSTELKSVFTHIGRDGQSLLPRRSQNGTAAEGSFTTTGAFGFRISSRDFSDTLLNPQRKIGLRIWKAIDFDGSIIPNAFIMANDYLGTSSTNYDYNDNMYFVTNIQPEVGTVYHALLQTTPSAIEFGEKINSTTDTFALQLQSLGKTYTNGTADPALIISSIAIVGENRSEFSAAMPEQDTLSPQQTTTLAVSFRPQSEGLKIADLLIYYNSASSPHRVPLYGIAKDSGTTVNLHYRIKSGSDTAMTIGGKEWAPDSAYAFDNLEPFANAQVTQITATDEDSLYFVEQSSNGDKRAFRYQVPLDSGSYVVRLHFSEVYWGAPGAGLSGGAGSRVMNVTMENELKMANLDIVKEAGVASALVRNIPVTVTDGQLNISFGASINRPSLSALEVYSFTRPVIPPEDTTTNPPVDTVVVPPIDTNVVPTPVQLTVYPNPSPGKFSVVFPLTRKQTVTFRITDMIGRRYREEQFAGEAGNNKKDMNLTALNLKPGLYLLELYYEEKDRDVVKLLLSYQ